MTSTSSTSSRSSASFSGRPSAARG
jgi:hypothetical protein